MADENETSGKRAAHRPGEPRKPELQRCPSKEPGLGKLGPAQPLIAAADYGSKGRGVRALSDIPAGTVIQRVAVLLIPEKDRAVLDKTIIFSYLFMWEHGTTEQDLYSGTGRAAIALGVMSLLNHSTDPNADVTRHIDDLEVELRATRDIRAGEEVTIDYGMDLWFPPA